MSSPAPSKLAKARELGVAVVDAEELARPPVGEPLAGPKEPG